MSPSSLLDDEGLPLASNEDDGTKMQTTNLKSTSRVDHVAAYFPAFLGIVA